MTPPNRLVLLLLLGLTASASAHAAGRAGKKAFQQAWTGRSVVVTRTLYSVRFDERSRLLPLVKTRDRVSGLTVVTPAGSSYYQFDARRASEPDIVDHDPDGVVSQLRNQYVRSMHLEHGAVQDVEPLMLVRYSPGVTLTVGKVQIDRDRVRVHFHSDGETDVATTLTVKFPSLLSDELTESALIEEAIGLFVTTQ
jgi:hypothetical protein